VFFLVIYCPEVSACDKHVKTHSNKSQPASSDGGVLMPVAVIFVGCMALIGSIVVCMIQTRIADNTLKHTQFKNAIEHLGHKEQSVILGGIYALHHLATNAPNYRKQVLDMLCSFVRTETTKPGYRDLIRVTNLRKWAEKQAEKHPHNPKFTDDIDWYNGEIRGLLSDKDNRIVSTLVIQTIINLLFRNPEERPKWGEQLSMQEKTTYFFHEDVKKYDADNFRADLSGARFWDLDMWLADFRYVDFYNADLSTTNCNGSDFRGARFRRANLNAVKIPNTRFSVVSEEDAWMHEYVTLSGAATQDSFSGVVLDWIDNDRKEKKLLERETTFVEKDDQGQTHNKVFIGDSKKASPQNDVLYKVFHKNETQTLSANDAVKLAEDLGLLHPRTEYL